jgi:DNA-binding beta-propeller fold protein YncE
MDVFMKTSWIWFGFASVALSIIPNSARADLLVIRPGNSGAHTAVLRFNEANGAYLSEFSVESEGFYGIAIGPDHHAYVTGNTLGYGEVLRFNPAGAFMGKFASRNLTVPGGLKFGPDGNLYATSIVFPDYANRGQVLRYNGTNGNFIDAFIPPASGGLSTPFDLLFGDNGFVYVADGSLGVLRYRASDGAFVDTFIPTGRSGLNFLTAIAFGLDGHFYVCDRDSNAVLRYDKSTGEFLGAFVASASGGLSHPAGLAFGPDGNLYVSSRNTESVLRYNGTTGTFIDVFVPPRAGGLRSPTGLAFSAPVAQLIIQRTASGNVIRWPAACSNFTLMCKSDLASGSWNVVTQRAARVGAHWCVTNDLAAPMRLYRLQKP